MSYTLNLVCGCTVYVSCHPVTNVAHGRIIERRGPDCRDRRHAVGVRLGLWEMLPDPNHHVSIRFNQERSLERTNDSSPGRYHDGTASRTRAGTGRSTPV